MAMKPQRIAIIGAGTAGLAAAIFLARQHHPVTLIERAAELTPVGAGLLLQPSGLNVLDVLGVRADIERYGTRIDGLYGYTSAGRCIMRTEYADLDAGLYGVGIHRASLCHVLDKALHAEGHARWMSATVQGVLQRGEEVIVDYQREGQNEQAAFDAVLIANGSASALRPPELVRYDHQYPWGAMWAVLPQTPEFAASQLQQRYLGSHIMAGLLPSGTVPHAPQSSLLSFFWSLPVSEMPAWQSGDIAFQQWKAKLIEVWPQAEATLAPLQSSQSLIAATYRDVIMTRWAQGRIGVIGDAAHAMSPQLGQGANMALVDAKVLADAIGSHDNWGEIWMHYHRQREGAIRFYQTMSRLLTPMFQSRISTTGFVRDVAFPLMNQVPWLRGQMVRTVAGMKSGFLS